MRAEIVIFGNRGQGGPSGLPQIAAEVTYEMMLCAEDAIEAVFAVERNITFLQSQKISRKAPQSGSWRAGGVGRVRGGTRATGTGRGGPCGGCEGPFGAPRRPPARRPPGPVWTVLGGVEWSGGRCDGRLSPSYHPLTAPGRGGLSRRRHL